jgi:hypothetical protein
MWCAQATILRGMEVIRRRRTVSTLLALFLAIESVTVVSVAAASTLAPRSAAQALPAATPAGQVLAETGTAARSSEPAATARIATPDARDDRRPGPVATTPVAKATPKAAPVAKATPKVTKPKVTKPTVRHTTTAGPRPASYRGRNHVWIPSLGVNQSLSFFSCTRTAPPGNAVYRWGCAGTNNVYLLGHAYSVFKPLHDAYLNGRLVTGMKVYYADGSGRTRIYAVKWWRLTRPTTDASWAWASQAVPSMTLQTCMGASSQYRLIVRLVQVG